MKKKYKCVLCGKKCEGWGNNPYPLAEDGRCCDECNNDVIMARIIEMYKEENND